MQTFTIGWDIGGAHIKTAVLNHLGELVDVTQKPCALWRGLTVLEQVVLSIVPSLPSKNTRHVLTMTGELVDCFSSREEGVQAIMELMANLLAPVKPFVFAGKQGFICIDSVQTDHYMAIASANWIASAQYAAKHIHEALFVDIGSTTTDILLIQNHALQALGYSDYQRLVSGELIYTGVVRTAVMALAPRARFNGQDMGLMAEYFATMADTYRVTGDLNELHDQTDTADGAEKTPQASARRLSRMTGYEYQQTDWNLWLDFAHELKRQQTELLRRACLRQLQRISLTGPVCLIGAGVGRFLLKEIAAELYMGYLDFNQLAAYAKSGQNIDAADCAPAVAMAFLAHTDLSQSSG